MRALSCSRTTSTRSVIPTPPARSSISFAVEGAERKERGEGRANPQLEMKGNLSSKLNAISLRDGAIVVKVVADVAIISSPGVRRLGVRVARGFAGLTAAGARGVQTEMRRSLVLRISAFTRGFIHAPARPSDYLRTRASTQPKASSLPLIADAFVFRISSLTVPRVAQLVSLIKHNARLCRGSILRLRQSAGAPPPDPARSLSQQPVGVGEVPPSTSGETEDDVAGLPFVHARRLDWRYPDPVGTPVCGVVLGFRLGLSYVMLGVAKGRAHE